MRTIRNDWKKNRSQLIAAISGILLVASIPTFAEEPMQGEEEAVLTSAPMVPAPITRNHRTKMIVHLEVKEVTKDLAPGVQYTFWTFGGDVPGKFIRVREGDLVEFHLSNDPNNKMPHNIDLHAVTGQGGGAGASVTAPGHASVFSFTAATPGLFVYHCATAPVGMHIANGMYGLILVQPKKGYPKVDKEFYIMQSEFYTKGKNGQEGLQPFDMEKAIHEQPEYVVFNGSVGSTTGDKALTAKVGEKVRFFVGNAGPNLVSSFHVIGEIFDRVYSWGGSKADQENVQTVLVPAGGSAIVEFGLEVPATYLLVDHSIFRTFNKGSLGMLKVSGPENKAMYSGKQSDEVYHPEGSAIQSIATADRLPAPTHLERKELLERGKRVYEQICIACHQVDGNGIPTAFPPLSKSDFLAADINRAVGIALNGLTGPIVVNGEKFNGVMPKLELDDVSIASALTYILNSFGNPGGEVKIETVQEARAKQK